MSLAKKMQPMLTSALTSDRTLKLRRAISEVQRKGKGLPHEILFYHKVDDPYSYLLLQMLQKLMGDFDIKIKPRIISQVATEMLPEPEMLDEWSIRDAKLLAEAFDLTFPDTNKLPDKTLSQRAEKILFSNEKSDSFLRFALEVNEALWLGGEEQIQKLEEEVGRVSDEQREKLVIKNEKELKSRGHYLGATLFYGGEWYWGVDRLYHLAERLLELQLQKTSVDLASYDYPKLETPKQNSPAEGKTLDIYFSFRSPYSYTAFDRAVALCERYNVELNVKPILPMVMRGLPVPAAKRIYIFLDNKREAKRYGQDFGKVVDPLGEGVRRCMAIYPYAKSLNKEKIYISTVARGIWAEGKNVFTDKDLSALVNKAGLDWQEAKTYLSNDEWEKTAEQNRLDMIELGFWGVPTFQYDDFCCWGQDRLWAIEKAFNKA